MTSAATPTQPPPVLPDAPDDGVLVRRLLGGDADAGDVLVDRYTAPLLGYLRKLCRNDATAEELHQATWLSVMENLDRFDPATATGDSNGFKAWLFRIATNKANDHFRRSRRDRDRREKVGRDPTLGPASIDAPGASMDQSEQARNLQAAIDTLPEAQREVVLLRYFGGLKFTEIAETVGCPLNTALGRMHKAMNKLKAALGGEDSS